MNKKLLITTLALVLVGSGYLAATKVKAESSNSWYPPIVQKLVERFGLNESDVKAVFDEERSNRQTEMQNKFEERLTQAVSDGKITEVQKQAIIAKHQEIMNNRSELDEMKNLTQEERRSKMEEKRTEMENWAKELGIDTGVLENLMHGGMKGGRHMGW